MGVEIERKYLVNKDKWNRLDKGAGILYRQGYLLVDPEKTIRVRLGDNRGFITIKGLTIGASRLEYEYEIPAREAMELLDKFCPSDISKIRYKIIHAGKLWEVDEFLGNNEGLIVAEIELTSEQETFDLPDWVGEEVTDQTKYYNASLSIKPYKSW